MEVCCRYAPDKELEGGSKADKQEGDLGSHGPKTGQNAEQQRDVRF